MNITLWILQVVLALHTAMGAVWKFSHSAEQTMPSLKAIPAPVWLGLSVVEIACSLALVLPAVVGSVAGLVPLAAALVALEMLVFSALHLASGAKEHGPMIYWLVTAAVCAFVACGRWMLAPLPGAGG